MADRPVDRHDSPVRPTHWAQGPPTDTVTELLRTLELTISRRLDGVLHGNYQGLTPGHGSEPGESRPYAPGDDVRRIDWNVTARTQETYIREQIADHDLTAWLVVDASATMQFGTVTNTKAQTALAATAAVGFLTARNQNRVGAVMVAGPDIHVVPPRSGKNQIRAILSTLAAPPVSDGHGKADLAGALDRVGALAKRQGFVAVISDFAGSDWTKALGRLSLRHDLLVITVHDPREYDVPPIGLVQMTDPASGRTREVRVTESVQRKFITIAAEQRTTRLDELGRTGADTIELTTDGDWLGSVVAHVQRRRTQAVRGGVLTR
ncbi:DUF58 domain-containing protein [Ilumatobacter sp.]|uniref:DUF58 domain-containing protein n=1 Tax=Ilumatobacter sp. TaxID=1967498 RepID=UPI003F6C42F0